MYKESAERIGGSSMLDTSEMVNQFIRDLRSCDYYCRVIMEYNLKLEDINYRLQGVSSPSVKDIICENSSDPYSNAAKLELMEIETKLTRERQVYIDRIKQCEKIEAIESAEDRNLVIDLYVIKMRYADIENKYNYSRSAIFKRSQKILKGLF